MANMPHDATDLYLAPVLLALDARIEEFSRLNADELTLESHSKVTLLTGHASSARQGCSEQSANWSRHTTGNFQWISAGSG
jgi:hypothetical protein